jgi:hypothetical protein
MRHLLLLFLFICAIQVAWAQKFNSGLQFGLNTSQITGDNLAGYNKAGLTAGIWVNRQITERMSIWMELSYLPKGSKKLNSPSDSVPDYYRLHLNYIEVPISINYRVHPKMSIETGISCGAYISHTEEDVNGDISGIYGPREQFKSTDISFNAGLNWHFNSKWMLNVRNANSIFPVRNHDQQTYFRLNRGQYTSCIMGRILYQF